MYLRGGAMRTTITRLQRVWKAALEAARSLPGQRPKVRLKTGACIEREIKRENRLARESARVGKSA